MSALSSSAETREELTLFANDHEPEMPRGYTQFAFAWMTFNRIYNENSSDRNEANRIVNVGDQLEGIWDKVSDLARQLVSLECIGGEKDPSGILKPKPEVKTATLHLREAFKLDDGNVIHDCQFHACRPEKRAVCNPVAADPWGYSKMGALLRLVYQVRCNLVHGDKRFMARGFQAERDRELVHLSYEILKIILREISSTVGKAE